MNKEKKGLLVSDNPELTKYSMELASKLNLDLDLKYTRESRTGTIMRQLGATKINFKEPNLELYEFERFDFILSIHCSQIFPEKIYDRINCYNLHPGFNPHNRGWFPQVFSIINGKPIGATLHKISSLIDGGPVIKQSEVKVLPTDTSLEVYTKIIKMEKEIIFEYLPILFSSDYKEKATEIPFGNYNSKSDFHDICHLDLDSVGSLREHLDLLRALSHGSFKNAYFLDDSGERVYVSITLEKNESE